MAGGLRNGRRSLPLLLGVLILGRKRDRCRHCNKLLTDKEGILVDEDDSYECADNPDGDHHQLKRPRES